MAGKLGQLLGLIAGYPVADPQNEDQHELLDNIRLVATDIKSRWHGCLRRLCAGRYGFASSQFGRVGSVRPKFCTCHWHDPFLALVC